MSTKYNTIYITVDSLELLKSNALSSATIKFFSGPLIISWDFSNRSESLKALLITPGKTWFWTFSGLDPELEEPELSLSVFSLNFLNFKDVTGNEVSLITLLFIDLFFQLPHGLTLSSVQALF